VVVVIVAFRILSHAEFHRFFDYDYDNDGTRIPSARYAIR